MNKGKKMLQGSMLNSASLVLEVIIAFFMMPFLIHNLGDKMYGLWLLVMALLGYFNLSRLGLSSAVGRYLSRAVGKGDDRELSEITSTAFFVNLIFSMFMVLLTVGLIVVAGYVVKDPEDLKLFQILVGILGFNAATRPPLSIFGAMLGANLRYDILGTLTITIQIIRNILLFILVANGFGLISMALMSVFGNLLHTVVVIYYEKKLFSKLKFRLKNFRKEKVKEFFNYSVFTFLGQIAETLNMKVDTFVITAFVGLAAVTHYNVGFRLTAYFTALIGAIIGVCGTYFSQAEGRGDYDSIRKNFLFVTKLMTYLSVFIGSSIIFYGKAFILRWMGAEYLDSYSVLIVLTIPYMIGACQMAVGEVLRGISKHKFTAYLGIIIGIINVGLSLILVRKYGIVGVGLGTAIPVLLLAPIASGLYITKVLSIKRSFYFKFMFENFGKALFIVSVYFVCTRMLIIPEYSVLFLIGGAGALIYGCITYFAFFNKDERTLLIGLIK